MLLPYAYYRIRNCVLTEGLSIEAMYEKRLAAQKWHSLKFHGEKKMIAK